jgi:hypothetical protein
MPELTSWFVSEQIELVIKMHSTLQGAVVSRHSTKFLPMLQQVRTH